jgi:hypothetical protein
MKIDRRELGRHYAPLSDEELLSLNPDEPTESEQTIYDLEIKRRSLSKKPAAAAPPRQNPFISIFLNFAIRF